MSSSKSSVPKGKGKGKGKGKSGGIFLPKPPSIGPSWLPPKRFTCSQCGHSTDRKNDFENHMNQHTGHKLPWGTCGKVFYSEASRQTHMKNTHPNIKSAKCSIPGCLWEDKDFVHQFDAHGIGEEANVHNVKGNLITGDHTKGTRPLVAGRRTKSVPFVPESTKILRSSPNI